MNPNHKASYATPASEVVEVKTETSFLQMSQRNYTYRSLDEDDSNQEG